MTIVKSNKFHVLRRYAVGCCQKPYAIIFIMHSPVNITRNIYSICSWKWMLHMIEINGDLPISSHTNNTKLWFSHDLRQNNFLSYNSNRKEKIRRPMSNSYLMFSDITGYKTILYETKASIYEKAIEAILDSINGIIIIIGHLIMIAIGYFLTNNDLKDTLGYIKIWHFLTKSHFLQVTTTWRITNLKSILRRNYQIFGK